jgi:hypothetical protein
MEGLSARINGEECSYTIFGLILTCKQGGKTPVVMKMALLPFTNNSPFSFKSLPTLIALQKQAIDT